MELDLELWHYPLLVAGGVLTGLINSLAGNGSAISLSLMMFIGLPPSWANATNRIGVVFQTITAVLSLPRTDRVKELGRRAGILLIPSMLGAAIGAWLADETPDTWMKYVIGVVMVGLLFTLLFKPSQWKKEDGQERTDRKWGLVLYFFAIGLYGGYIQMGIGIMMLAVLVLYTGYGLVEANIIKLIIAFALTIPAFLVFLMSGKMQWPIGITLGLGQMVGAWVGTKYLLTHPRASVTIRYLLVVILLYAILRIFGLLALLGL